MRVQNFVLNNLDPVRESCTMCLCKALCMFCNVWWWLLCKSIGVAGAAHWHRDFLYPFNFKKNGGRQSGATTSVLAALSLSWSRGTFDVNSDILEQWQKYLYVKVFQVGIKELCRLCAMGGHCQTERRKDCVALNFARWLRKAEFIWSRFVGNGGFLAAKFWVKCLKWEISLKVHKYIIRVGLVNSVMACSRVEL